MNVAVSSIELSIYSMLNKHFFLGFLLTTEKLVAYQIAYAVAIFVSSILSN